MASNPDVNKVVFGDQTIMDITDTTAQAADVAEGKVFYAASGARTVGTLASGVGSVLTYGVSTYQEALAATEPVFISYTGVMSYAYDIVKRDGQITFWTEMLGYDKSITVESDDSWSLNSTQHCMAVVSRPVNGNLLTMDNNGQATNSGIAPSDKQDTLVSGTNIKTINNQSILGSGNINIEGGGGATVLTYGVSTYNEVAAATLPIVVMTDNGETCHYIYAKNEGDDHWWLESDGIQFTVTSSNTWSSAPIDHDYYTKLEADALLADKVDTDAQATDSTLGLVKLNPSQSIDVNANGQLTVGGRLGQFPSGGVFYPTDIEPTLVSSSSFLMTDGAKGLSAGNRTFGIMGGANLTCKSAAAGTTQYRLSNTQSNRFACFAVVNGRAAIDQNDATVNGTALITDISFANGNPIAAYYGPTESANDIILTLERTVNPDAATTKLRVYGTTTSSDVIIVGQGNGATHGKAISLGQSCRASGNQTIAFGNSSVVMANNSVALGHTHLVNKQFCLAAGQGHDFTSGVNGSAAVGIASLISSNTLFAVGNGTFNANGNIVRSNAFEVTDDGGIVLKSPDASRWKITVDNSGNLTTTKL